MESTSADTAPRVRNLIAGEVLALMGRNRVTQTRLAKALRISQPQLSERLNGRVSWRVDELEAICRFFQVPVSQLFGGDPLMAWNTDTGTLTSGNAGRQGQLPFLAGTGELVAAA